MSFETDTIDGYALLDEGSDGLESCGEFSPGSFEVVVVEVEFGVGVSGVGGARSGC